MNLKEIARAAGVSQSTVTIVLHGRDGVSAATKKRISAMLEENGYTVQRPQESEPKTSKKIIFIKYKRESFMVDGNPEYISKLVDEVERCCNQENYELVFKVADPGNLLDVFEKVNKEPFEGIIFLGTEFSDEDRPLLKNVKKPIVIIDNDLVRLSVTSVSTHTWNSMRGKVEYLMRRGHRKIGYLRNTSPTSICTECFRGYLNAMREYGLEVFDEYIYDVDPTFEGAYASMKKLLEKGIRLPSALVCNSDCLALGAMKAMQEYGVRVPQNVSIISGDNIASCTMYSPQLTTCDAHACAIGKWAVKLLQEQITNPEGPVVRLRVETTIIERESVCDYSEYIPFDLTVK